MLFLFVFGASCGGQNKPALPTEKIGSEAKEVSASRWTHTRYEYTDAAGASLIIENGLPRGGQRYTDPDGEVYTYAVFWTRIINETANPLELKIDFPADALELPWLPGKYYQVLVPPDTMTPDKEGLFNYGLTKLESFLDNNMHQPSSLKRTIHPKGAGGFYVVILGRINEAAHGALRTGLRLEGQDLFYRVSLVKGPPPLSLIGEKEIQCGSISLKDLVLQE
ncbi:MAG: hypothetical protein ABW019_02615 [Chitinophagaceae bacterium]